MNVTTALPAQLGSVSAARRFVASVLEPGDFDDETVAATVLLTSELAANAAVHGGGDAIRIRLACRQDVLRVEVDDPSDALPEPDGRPWSGVGLVERLSLRWGVDRLGQGKRVWCEVRPPERVEHPSPEATGPASADDHPAGGAGA